MNRLLLLLAGMLTALLSTAQEIWDASSITDLTKEELNIEATQSITLKIVSTLNEKDIEDQKAPWQLDQTAGNALNTTECSPQFTSCLKGMGNPYITDAGGHWEDTENGRSWRDDPNAVAWTPGCGQLPLHGMYLLLTAKASGTLKLGVYINKGNHQLYVVEAQSIKELPNTDMEVAFYYQNNGFSFQDGGQMVSFVQGTMPADYIIQHTNGYNQNRPALGYVTFPVEAGKSYYVFCPKSQVGLYGLYFSTGQSSEVTATFKVSPDGAGSVSPASMTVLSGTSFTATATAHAGYAFEGWYAGGELVSSDNPHQFTLSEDAEITAQFAAQAANTVTGFVKPSCQGMGTVRTSPSGTAVEGGSKFNYGTEVTFTASPARGYRFSHWEDETGTVLTTATTFTATITTDRTVYAVFQPLENYKADLIAFPGAEGWGRFTTGGRAIDGRGSKVYYVTRLDDCSDADLVEGTLRWALRSGDDTPRTILFKVSGTIYLTSRLSANHPNVTIAGQTAPGGGICIAGYQTKLNMPNTIVRHIRFRAGDLANSSMSALDVENTHHMIFDHCSFTWSMEENLTLYDTDSTTVQWCILSEGLYNSKNSKGARSYAAQWGGEHGTLHHCLFSNCNNRSPRFNGVRASTHDRHVDNEFINNVVYNWGKPNSLYGAENNTDCNGYNRTYMINNYFRPGPATQQNVTSRRYFVGASSENGAGQWYLSGNKFELSSKWAPANQAVWTDEQLQLVNADNLHGFATNSDSRAFDMPADIGNSQASYDKYILTAQTLSSGVATETADEAYQSVVRGAGASLPRYDEIDRRLLDEAAGTADPQYAGYNENGRLERGIGIINSPYDITLQQHDDFVALDEATDTEISVTCYPRLQMDTDDCQLTDTDGDGLPDDYELQVGLNPADDDDGQQLTESGYSNLELFLNGVADGTIDATLYTRHQPTEPGQLFNAIVDATLTADAPSATPAEFKTVQAAVDAADGTTPYYIFIRPGTYEEHVSISKANVHLTGQDKQNTIISYNLLAADGGVDVTSTINVTGNDVSLDNLTIRNTRVEEGQALALYTKADRIRVTSCNLEGWQDTYRTGKGRQRHIVRNCKISGTTDFIYGEGEVFFDADTIHVVRKSNVITAPAQDSPAFGYVFRDAVITSATPGSKTHLGRPWHNTPKVAFINTRLDEGVSIPAEGWYDMGGLPTQMAEYNTTDADGNIVDLSQRATSFTADGVTKPSKAVLTPLEASVCTLDNVLRGSDRWDADWQAFILPAPELTVSEGSLSWTDATGFARCFLVVTDGVGQLTTDTSCAYDGQQQVSIQAVSAYGVLGEPVTPAAATAITPLSPAAAPVVSRQYFTPDGRRLPRLAHGVTIVRTQYADGTTRTTKITAK